MTSYKKFWRISIHVPSKDAPDERGLDNIAESTCKDVNKIIEVITYSPGVGEVGNYNGIYEIGFGFEGYQPTKGAKPQHGKVGEKITIGKAVVITYIALDREQEVLEKFVSSVRAVHPWEHPIIEILECLLYVPVSV